MKEIIVNHGLFISLVAQIFIFLFSLYWATRHLSRKKEVLQTLNQFNDGQEKIYNLDEMGKYLVMFFASIASSKKSALFLYSRQRNELRLFALHGLENYQNFPPLVTGKVANWALQLQSSIVPLKTCSQILFEESFPSLRDRLEKEQFSFLIPLTDRGFLLGLIALGQMPKSPRTDLMEPLANAAGRSIESLYLYESSVTDETTGLYNKRFLGQMLQAELRRADRYGQPCSLLTFDIDDFKKINDTYGHPQGDLVLKELASRVQECLREGIDIAARTGGEEFAVVLPATDAERAVKIGERVRKNIREHPFPGFPEKQHVTISIGTATYPAHANQEATLMSIADQALYAAKSNGKDRLCSAAELKDAQDNEREASSPREKLNLIDTKTSLYTTDYFSMRLKDELKRAERYKFPCSLTVIGFDKSESFEAIRKFAPILRESLRKGIDAPAAMDFQHIAILLPEIEEDKAGIMAQRILHLAGDARANAGIACFPADGRTGEVLLEKASQALAEAQKMGGNHCVLWKETA